MSPKNWFLGVSVVLVVAAIVRYEHEDDPSITIGIIQTASHPALDLARDGFSAELERLTQHKVRFVVQNAQGQLSQANSIAESFHSKKAIQAIFAIGTPAVQAAIRAEKQKPILIAAVSDPESLGIIHPGSNVCGTTDRVDCNAQADLISKITPKVQTVAILHNPSERNSVVMCEKMQHALIQREIIALVYAVHTESEIAQTVHSACKKADLLLLPTDNLMATSMPIIAKESLKAKRAVIASDVLLVENGALCAQGADYRTLGIKTAAIAYKVLWQNTKPDAIGVLDPDQANLVVNQPLLQALQIQLGDGP